MGRAQELAFVYRSSSFIPNKGGELEGSSLKHGVLVGGELVVQLLGMFQRNS